MKDKIAKLAPGRMFKRSQDPEDVPRITNDTVAAHREEVLNSARKYVYPLQHSKDKIVMITTTVVIVAFIAFFSYCMLALYRLETNSTFIYRVTQVLPFPIARAGKNFIAYENYLFELRHYTHYYTNQQQEDFTSERGQQQLAEFKKRALDKVVNDAYVKQIAKQHGIVVTDQEIEAQIDIMRKQNRLGGSDKVFEDVLRDYWGWSVNDFKRSLRTSLLAQKVVAQLDTETHQQAEAALAEVQGGADFAEVAKKYSEDPTKENNGEFGFPIERNNRDLSAQTTEALFALKPGEHSGIINIGHALQIVKNLEENGGKIRAAHIQINFEDISKYVNDLKEQQKATIYVTFD